MHMLRLACMRLTCMLHVGLMWQCLWQLLGPGQLHGQRLPEAICKAPRLHACIKAAIMLHPVSSGVHAAVGLQIMGCTASTVHRMGDLVTTLVGLPLHQMRAWTVHHRGAKAIRTWHALLRVMVPEVGPIKAALLMWLMGMAILCEAVRMLSW